MSPGKECVAAGAVLHELVLRGAVPGLCRELGLLHRAAGGQLNPGVPSAPSETSRVNKRAVFAQENPAWGELEPHLCYRRETLCNSLPNSPRVCKSTNLLSGCQPAPALPPPIACLVPGGSWGPSHLFLGDSREDPPSSPMAGRAAQPWCGKGFVPPSFQHSPSHKRTKQLVGIKHQLRLGRGGLNTPAVIPTYAQRYNPDLLLALAPFFFFF